MNSLNDTQKQCLKCMSDRRKLEARRQERIFRIALTCILLMGLIIVSVISYADKQLEKAKAIEPEIITIYQPEYFVVEDEIAYGVTYLGEYRITAYCPCEICCGTWALNRKPGPVTGASGNQLIAGKTCATASNLPFGTKLYIEGHGVVTVEDRGAQWVTDKYNGKFIDLYFNTHEDCYTWFETFKKDYAGVFIYEEQSKN